MKNKTKYLVLTGILLIMTACAMPGDSSDQTSASLTPTADTDPAKAIFFPRQQKPEGERAVMEALLTDGRLVLVDNCIRVDSDEAENSYLLIWPPDFSLSIEDDTINLLNESGEIVASIGDRLTISGGEVPVLYEPVKSQVPAQCTGPYWIIGDEVSRIETSK